MSSVLIIDDDRLVIEQLTELISSFGHEVAFVPKPSFALQRLEKDPFNLILIDVNMPEINGIELLKRIKANDAWSTIPVIMMTGEGDNDTLADCFEYGANDFIEKPINAIILKARVNALIRSQELINAELSLKEQEALQYKLRSLISQMNPHFIFNVLNSIQFHVMEENKEVAIESISQFSKLVRTSLNNSDKEFISLQTEIDFLTTYLNLEMDRFRGKLFFNIEVSENIDVEDIMVPPMLIQPFVENAIVHGIGNKEGKGNIQVTFSRNDTFLNCIITDDGVGRKKANELKQMKVGGYESKGMSLTEVRMEMLNNAIGKGFETEMQDQVHADGELNGTKVIVRMPLISQWEIL